MINKILKSTNKQSSFSLNTTLLLYFDFLATYFCPHKDHNQGISVYKLLNKSKIAYQNMHIHCEVSHT
jgi:hypothetical protein